MGPAWQHERVLPPRLLWRDPRPIPRLDPQEPVTVICDPAFHEPRDDDDCTVFSYACLSHEQPYRRGACGAGPHLIALECTVHGLETMWPQPGMMLFPAGFTPPLSAEQFAEIQAAWGEAL